jgi:5-hydroxyisourate hydrolase
LSSPLTTHVLDTARGRPAAGLPVRLEHRDPKGGFLEVTRAVTDADGRVADLLTPGAFEEGVWRLTFDTDTYHRGIGQEGFYPYVEVVFRVTHPDQHHHVPLLLSPYGYSTYRGS